MVGERKDCLLEIGVEEMPARFLDPALAELKKLAAAALGERRLDYKNLHTYGSPRRITLLVAGMAVSQAPLEKEIKGPAVKVAYKDGVPTRAAKGFAAGQGVKVTDLVQKSVGHVDYVFAVKREAGRLAQEVLSSIFPDLISGLHFPKPMRWGEQEFRFARPIRWIVSLFGTDVVEFEFTGLQAGRTTYGHRFLSKKPVVLAQPAGYVETMRKNYVLVDVNERKKEIWRQVGELAQAAGGAVEEDTDLLNEITNLVEYPTALIGEFNADYLKLPKEVLVTSMREHQRYFPVVDDKGQLLAKFIAVKNGAADHLDIIRAGNEKVLRARLADADFFYQEDLKTPLAERVQELKKVVFQEKLGTVYDKTVRVGETAAYLAGVLGIGEEAKEVALRTAALTKADLVTNMVNEFPELQGYMGREYALRGGEQEAVARAIYEHYLPRFAGDRLPQTMVGKILSIADKTDTIVGCFAIGIQPTGSQDPYALRRQALGVSNIILETKASLSLEKLIETSYCSYQGKVQLKLRLDQVKKEVAAFFKHRIRGILDEKGFTYDTIDAVLSAGYDDFNDILLRAKALAEFRQEADFADLLTAFVRANNLSKKAAIQQINPDLLADPAEKELYRLLAAVQEKAGDYLKQQDYRSLFSAIATLQGPLDEFFTSVLVMVDEEPLRNNRLALLASLAALVKQVADLTKVVVSD